MIALLASVLIGFAARTRPLDLTQDLAAALDGPDSVARRASAIELARRSKITIEDWVAAIQAVSPSREVESLDEPGPHSVRVALHVLDAVEETELEIFVPSTLHRDRPAPLLLAFHGTGGSGKEVEPMWRATAEKLGMIVLAPSEAGKNDGYAFSPRERAAALAALRWANRNFLIDVDRVFATGISRGGHLAWDLALRHPDLLAAIAPMIGGPRFQLDHGQNNLRFLENVVSLPIRDLQGSKDDPGLVANVRLAFGRLATLAATDAKLLEFPELGHAFEFGAVDWAAFFGTSRRNPTPERVVRLAVDAGEGRAFWVQVTKVARGVAEDVVPNVIASTWNGLDENGRRKLLEGEVEKRTARLEVKRTGIGRFTATGDRVAGFRLFLTTSMFDPTKPVQVLFGGKLVEKKATVDAGVLLEDFVERMDRSFLPVASIDVP